MVLTGGGRVAIEDGLRRSLTIFSIGFAALALLVFALGLAGAFERGVLVGVTIGGAALALPFLYREARRARRVRFENRAIRWLLAATAAILVLGIVLASAPPTSGDAIAYHFSAPKEWLDAGRIFPIWWQWQAFQPFSPEMHFALAEALDGGRAAGVVAGVLGAFSAACVFGLARELGGPTVAAVSSLLWVGQGMFLWEATGGFVELTLSGFAALSAWHLLALRHTQRLLDAAWAGLALGLAIGTKYHGLVFVPFLAVLAVAVVAGPARRRALMVGSFAALAAVGLPWYVRNWVVAGNPVYPFAADLFGGRYLDAGSRYDLDQSLSGHGLDGIWRLPFFPLEFLLHTDRYERGYSFSPALFLLPPVAVALGTRAARLVGLGMLVYLVIWWEGMQQITRYLLPALAFAAVLGGGAAVALARRRGWGRRYLLAVAAVTAVPFAAITGLFTWQIAPGVLGVESEGAFVQRLTGTYRAFQWLDNELPPDGRVLIGIRDLYWLERPHLAFDVPLFNFQQPTPQAVARMRHYDVRYLAFPGGRLPAPLEPLRPQLRLLARLDVPFVTSRTLGRVRHEELVVWAWCTARGRPCDRNLNRSGGEER